MKTYTPRLPKRPSGNNVLGLYGGDNNCALACFHSIASHKNTDFFCSTAFPVTALFSDACNFTGFNDFELESCSPTSSVPLGSFSCHWCCSCLVRSEFDCVLLFQMGFSLGLV